ncbi:MAG: FAD-binding oxidoreductase [Deltaproteobacteria bacterium]|nr:FAD-binding oxidoreductase [Deltaproteobacteria bacterium]
MSPLPEGLRTQLAAEFPADLWTTEPSELAEFGRDWTRVYPPAPGAVAFPRSTDEVSRLVKACVKHGVAIVPSGGRTGLAAGAVAARGELVISLSRMRRMDAVDLLGQTVRVQAGAITEAVHKHVAEHGLTWPVDFASKGSSTVGGNIATNAGGVKVIRYGLTRNWVLGLQVVLANGEILELNGALEKNNTGADLRQLFIGSEGTLGIVTEATLKLTRVPGKLDVLLFAVPDLAGVLKLFREARSAGPFGIMAYEFFTDVCLARVQKHRKLRAPFEQPASHYVLLEVERADATELETWVASLFERNLVQEGVLAANLGQAQELWSYREAISESLSATGLPHKNDIALPIAALEAFCDDLQKLLASKYPDFEIALFGHIGDGNLHVNIMKPDAMEKDAFFARAKQLDPEMFALVQQHHGSISAEHGVGLLKKPYLGFSRTPAELTLLRSLKRALDPGNLLNPGKILDAE